jgi:hypothetical protein
MARSNFKETNFILNNFLEFQNHLSVQKKLVSKEQQ